jgi:hypothetical protein
MVCLFHGDYGPPDPAFSLDSGSAWVVNPNSLKKARNLGEADAIQRHLLRGEEVSWCHQGYAWVDQDAVVWFYFAAFLFVVLPFLIMRARAWAKAMSRPNVRAGLPAARGSSAECVFWKEHSVRLLRLVPDDTKIQFMRGRFAGVIGSAILSTLSVVLFFYPGLNLGVDFRGGGVVELHGPRALQVNTIREAFAPLGFSDLRVQEFGSPQDVLVRFENKARLQDAQRLISSRVAEALPGVQIRRTEVVGARVSSELFRNGLLATGLALVAVLVYIWFRFEWQFGVGVVATLILDVTKTVGFFAVTQIV